MFSPRETDCDNIPCVPAVETAGNISKQFLKPIQT